MTNILGTAVLIVCVATLALATKIVLDPEAVGAWEAKRDQGYFRVMGTDPLTGAPELYE